GVETFDEQLQRLRRRRELGARRLAQPQASGLAILLLVLLFPGNASSCARDAGNAQLLQPVCAEADVLVAVAARRVEVDDRERIGRLRLGRKVSTMNAPAADYAAQRRLGQRRRRQERGHGLLLFLLGFACRAAERREDLSIISLGSSHAKG